MSLTPLVTIAIPSYKPRHFEAALLSAMAQSYERLEILISDDCPSDAVQQILRRHVSRGRHEIRVIRNRPGLGGLMNYTQCVVEARGEFVKILNDDDILMVDCIERMVDVFQTNPDISLVTSRRVLIDTLGVPTADILATCSPFAEDAVIQGADLAAYLVDEPINFIGEPSTVLFRREHLADIKPHIACLNGHTVRAINDLAMYVNILRHGHLAYLCEPLSCFRRHDEQRQQQSDIQDLYRQYIHVFTSQIREMGLYHPQPNGQVRYRPLGGSPDEWQLFPLRQRFREEGARLAYEQQHALMTQAVTKAAGGARIHQIFYSPETRAMLEPGFTPLDNCGQRPDWAEYWPIRNLLLNKDLDENAFYGVLSPRFKQKTGLDSGQVLEFVKSAPDDVDVLLFPMFFDELAFYENTFIQGFACHPNIWPAFVEMARQLSPGVNLETLVMDARRSQFCNFFIAKPRFWRHWFSKAETIFHAAEQARSGVRPTPYGAALNEATLHRGEKGYECKVFVMERLVSLILATESQWRVLAYDPLKLAALNRPVDNDYLRLNELKARLCEKDSDEIRAAYEVLREKVFRTVCAEKIAELGGNVRPIAEQIKAALRNVQLLPTSTSVSQWLAKRIPSEAQQRLIAERLSTQAAPTFGVLVLDCEGRADRLMSTLQSLSQECNLYSGLNVVALTPYVLPGASVSQNALRYVRIEGTNPLPGIEQAVREGGFDWFMLVEAGTVFTASGLLIAALDLLGAQGLRAVYGDEVVGSQGKPQEPVLRPDLNLDMLLSLPSTMASHWLFNREAWLSLGGFRSEAGRAFELDFILRMIEDKGFEGLGHISEPLLIRAPTVLRDCEDERHAIHRHLQARGFKDATVESRLPGHYELDYGVADGALVSILVSTQGGLARAHRCMETILEKTAYRAYEVLLLDQCDDDPALQAWLEGLEQLGSESLRVVRFPAQWSQAQVRNQAARQARGELLLWLDSGVAVLEPDWLLQLVNHACRQEVGAVGAKLLAGDCTVRQGGLVLGLNGTVGQVFTGQPMGAAGYLHRLLVDQNHAAISGKCLMTKASVFLDAGGFDESPELAPWTDVDLCLRLHSAGYLNVWTPRASLLINEASEPAVTAEQADALYARWLPLLARDPSYNPNLSLGAGDEFSFGQSELSWRPLSSWQPVPTVLAYAADQQGSEQYRIIQPLEQLNSEGLIDGTLIHTQLSLTELERFAPDSIVLQPQINEVQLERMRRMQAFSRAFKVYDMDERLLSLSQGNDGRSALAYSDRLVVSTEALAETLTGLHHNIRVVHNRLDPRLWADLASRRRRSARPRVGWVGGRGHDSDPQLMIEIVKSLSGEVEWVYFGMCPDVLRPYINECHAIVAIDDYATTLARLDLDLALAPREQTLVNECKSNLRLLEYGACGFPVVCSDLACYGGDLPVTRVRNNFEDWLGAIRMHLSDLDATARMGDELRARVKRDWMLGGEHLQRWREAWLPG
ncbi:glycosyltransferase [Pseudomonas guariconensis]|uniref:glycosyltransferase n=1 Tax=Pseudomonas guariconensis TaxID=1288410 RepID=UPI002D1EB069|nr:glycosyltransferase [Pseudomonas guariconensis]MEB3840436.1 glycosyltransferase [Pseudomonas guariconensis]MEB3873304.1 glycosyltransferase [Pseudomonas guariconensis]MEB3878681.1 glycosyltransferase [Pseudomonas guariconensis]MEB3896172.1 glycosyltransferase [Pseudomonas guariconensis]